MKLFDATPPEFPEGHHSNLPTGKLLVTPEEIMEAFKQSTSPDDFSRRLAELVRVAELESLLDRIDFD